MNARPLLALAALLALFAATPRTAASAPADSASVRIRRLLGNPPARTPAQVLGDTTRTTAPLPPRPTIVAAPSAPEPPPEGPAIPDSLPNLWRTRAERTGWRQTANYDETIRYCRQLEAGSNWVRYVSFGTSGQGRDLPLLVVSRDRAFTPEAARATGKPVVLIQNGIHSGEIEGKDASLALVRDMAVLRTREHLLDSCIVLVIPILSVDAHERRGRFNRINQNGPEEMGWRTTPVGLNLNRDYLKTDAPEMRALIENVYTRWWPEILVDDHTTDGADYQHDVTYGFAHGPVVPPSIEQWCVEAFEGRVIPKLAAKGHLPAPYLSFRHGNDPASGIDFGNTPPRFSTGYTATQGRIGLLVETHMLKPYGTRVIATYDLLVSLLEEIQAHPRSLRAAVRDADAAIAAKARATDPAARTVVLSSHTSDRSVPFAYRGRVTRWETSPITGARVARYSPAPWDTIVPLYREMVADVAVREPAGYLIPREWSAAIALLERHGVRVRRFARAWSDTVEVSRITDWTADAQPSEGHHPVRVRGVATERRWRTWAPGDAWVPLDQRGALLAVNLCEAQAPDGMLTWNVFDTVLERKEYAEDYVMDPIARDMLAKDPKLAAEFQAKLAADSTFAKNPFARTDFFYRRSPWADPEQNLLPIARALRPVPETALAPATR